MLKECTASLSKEGNFFVAQCLGVDIASHGCSQSEAI